MSQEVFDLRCARGRFPDALGDGITREACPFLGVGGPERRRMFFVWAMIWDTVRSEGYRADETLI